MSILRQIPSEAKIKRELKDVVFGKVLRCPRCGSRQVKKYGQRYHCKRCRKPFSLISCTWLKGMKLSLATFYLLLWCWLNKTPVDQTRKVAGLSEPTVRLWYEKFRNHLPQDKLDELRLEGVVQIDEAYRGAKNNRFSIIGAKQAKNHDQRKKVIFQVLRKSSVDRRDAVDFLAQGIVPNSELWSDGAAIYKGIGNWWSVRHKYERHNKWEFALTSEIEGLWGNLFTFIRRTYHHVTGDKMADVVREFTARFCFPEWFESQHSYLKVALQPIPQKPSKKQSEFLIENMLVLSFNQAKKLNNLVPSC